MSESELKLLFTPEEYDKFLGFLLEHNYFWQDNFCYVEFVQEFMMELEDDDRKDEIIYQCIQKYPQILGIVSESN